MLHSIVDEHLLTQDSIPVPCDGPVEVTSLGAGVAITGFQPETEEMKLDEVSMSTEDTGPQVSVDTIAPDTSPVADAAPPVPVSPFRG